MIYDLSNGIEIDLTHDESKYVDIEIANQKVKIPNWFSINAVKKYFQSYKIDKNYRKAFCKLVLEMVTKRGENDKNLKMEDVESVSDDELIKIMFNYLDNHRESNIYFEEVFKEDYFEAFYLMQNKIISEMKKQLSESIGNLSKIISESINPIIEYPKIMMNSFSEQIRKSISEVLISIPKIEVNWEALEDNQKELAKKMIKNGWYFTSRLPINVKELIQLNDREFNRAICKFYEEELDDMCKMILLRFPSRKRILEKCFIAHCNKDYELCIPTMLAQADGISDELFNRKLFNKNYYGEPLTKSQTNIMFDADSVVDIAYYLQLSITGQLNKSCTNPKFFNRHTVMHGKDIYYAKKTNSIRCIAILNFLAEIKEYYLEDKVM